LTIREFFSMLVEPLGCRMPITALDGESRLIE
jgi:hypothetical protein